MKQFIPAPYVDHREAWRKVYTHLYGDFSKDEQMIALYRADIAKAQAKLDAAPKRRAHPAVDPGHGYINRSVNTDTKTVTLPEVPLTDPVPHMIDSSRWRMPQDRIEATRDRLLQSLYEGGIRGFILLHDILEISDQGIWIQDEGARGLSSGKISLKGTRGPRTELPTLLFSNKQLCETFPLKIIKQSGNTSKRKPLKAHYYLPNPA